MKEFIYSKPQIFEIKLTQIAQGDVGEGSGGLPPGPPGENPWQN